MKIRERERERLKGRVGNELEKAVRNSSRSIIRAQGSFFWSSDLVEGKWVTRLNGSQDVVPSIIQYGLG